MTRVAARPEVYGALTDGLMPVLYAIGASMGPERRNTLYATGKAVRVAISGVEIGRRMCAEQGMSGLVGTLLRETLVKADRDFGDGTARLAVMTGAALREGVKALLTGLEPDHLTGAVMALRGEIDAAFAALTENGGDREAQVLASGLPPCAARALVAAFEAAGEGGRVELSQGHAPGVELSAEQGFVLDALPVEQHALTALDDVSLLVADERITDFRTLVPVIEGFANRRKALVVAARAIEGQALGLLERNRQAGVLTVTALVPCDQGPRAGVLLEDLAIATGARLVAERTGVSLEALRPGMLGHAAHLVRQRQRVTLTGTAGDQSEMARRLGEIEGDIKASRYLSLDREHAERRRARLMGRWVELTLGGDGGDGDEAMLDRARRGLASLGHARRGGVIRGAGIGLEQVAERLAVVRPLDAAERAARALVTAALRAPARQLRFNSGQERRGQQAESGQRLDSVLDKSVCDPASLSRDLLEQALSLSLSLLSLESAVLRDVSIKHDR